MSILKIAKMGNPVLLEPAEIISDPKSPEIVELIQDKFKNVRIINKSITTTKEQRKTEWMPFESLKDAIDIVDTSKTIEGLPAPKRVVIIAKSPS